MRFVFFNLAAFLHIFLMFLLFSSHTGWRRHGSLHDQNGLLRQVRVSERGGRSSVSYPTSSVIPHNTPHFFFFFFFSYLSHPHPRIFSGSLLSRPNAWRNPARSGPVSWPICGPRLRGRPRSRAWRCGCHRWRGRGDDGNDMIRLFSDARFTLCLPTLLCLYLPPQYYGGSGGGGGSDCGCCGSPPAKNASAAAAASATLAAARPRSSAARAPKSTHPPAVAAPSGRTSPATRASYRAALRARAASERARAAAEGALVAAPRGGGGTPCSTASAAARLPTPWFTPTLTGSVRTHLDCGRTAAGRALRRRRDADAGSRLDVEATASAALAALSAATASRRAAMLAAPPGAPLRFVDGRAR